MELQICRKCLSGNRNPIKWESEFSDGRKQCDKCIEYGQTYRDNNGDHIRAYIKAWAKTPNGIQGRRAYCKQFRAKFPELVKKYRAISNKRWKQTPYGKIRHAMDARMRQAINHGRNIMQFVGCNTKELKSYLESKFKPSMTWDNYGTWHIDHIVPISWFDLNDPDQIKLAFHYTNLKPMWAQDNIVANDKTYHDTHVIEALDRCLAIQAYAIC